MHILNQGENHWKLRIESEDDLWVLARLASNGRHLAMLGERRDTTTAESGSRAKAAERKKMWIELRILSTEYQSYSTFFVFMEQLYKLRWTSDRIIHTSSRWEMTLS